MISGAKPVELEEYRPYEQELRLRWQVRYYLIGGETCRIICSKTARAHKVFLHQRIIDNPGFYECDVVHELSHGYLAERIDPAFATLSFSARLENLQGKKNRLFERRARMLYWAWCQVDIWVDDVVYEFWPNLIRFDQSTVRTAYTQLMQSKKEEHLASLQNICSIAMHKAEAKRYNLERPDFLVQLSGLEEGIRGRIFGLSKFYESLPRLSYKRENDLKVLEDSVKRAVQVLGFSISPRLVKEKGEYCWDV